MSYGTNNPQGCVAIRTLSQGFWNGQIATYPIASGYANNIFSGDLAGGKDGYLVNYADYCQNTGQAPADCTPVLGVFAGCAFVAQNAPTQTPPTNPWWPAGTILQNAAIPARGFVIVDPNVFYDIQVGTSAGIAGPASPANPAAATQASCFLAANPCYQLTGAAGSTVAGNTQTGQSLMYLDMSTITAAATANDQSDIFFIDSITENGNNAPGVNFNNVTVKIQNSIFMNVSPGRYNALALQGAEVATPVTAVTKDEVVQAKGGAK